VDVLSYILPVYGLAAALLIVLVLVMGNNFLGYRPSTYLYFVLLAVVPQLIGHSCLNWALAHSTATIVAVCILGEPIGAGAIAYIVLGEQVSTWQACGAGLILTGILFSTRDPKPAADVATA
jgi:drug/metabolite transporter (DMT)-like permease